MKTLRAAIMAASALALLAPLPVLAIGHGFHGHGHFSGHMHAGPYHYRGHGRYGPYGTYSYWPYSYGGGVVVAEPDESEALLNYPPQPTVVYVPLPPQALTCHRSREIVTVPAENGGTAKVTITRC